MDFNTWIEFTRGYDDDAIARRLELKTSTVKSWRRRLAPPAWASDAIAGIVDGAPPRRAGVAWSNWKFGADGLFYAPDIKRGFSPSDLRQLHWLIQSNAWRTAGAKAAQTTPPQESIVPPPPLLRACALARCKRSRCAGRR